MKKIAMILLSFITITLLVAGCSSSKDIQDFSIEEIALEEAKKITSEQGYTLKSETLTESDIMIGDSKVFDFIKEASIEGGYSKDDFNSITEDRKIVGYELEEKSKIDEPIMLCMVIDKGKVIGAYLDYSGYIPGITSIDFKDDFKQF